MTAALNTVAFVNGGDNAPRNRPALAQAFRDNATGGVFIGVREPPQEQGQRLRHSRTRATGRATATRSPEAAAELLAAWLGTDPTGTE